MKHARAVCLFVVFGLFGTALAQESGSRRDFVEAMLGHLEVVIFERPEEVKGMAGNDVTPVCCVSDDSFGLFWQQWDLYADWESEMPVVAFALDAWEFAEGRYNRGYAVAGEGLIVSFYELEDGDSGHVLVIYQRSPCLEP